MPRHERRTRFFALAVLALGVLAGAGAAHSGSPATAAAFLVTGGALQAALLYLLCSSPRPAAPRQSATREAALLRDLHKAQTACGLKDHFLALLSHELRTPLTPVLTLAGAWRSDERLPPEFRADLELICRNLHLQARLIDDLLDLTRIARGKLQLQPELRDAHELIADAVEMVRFELAQKGLQCHLELKAPLSGLQVDPDRFEQILWNLLKNALKFTPAGGHITIRTTNRPASAPGRDPADRLDGSDLLIEVCDTGRGIEPERLDTLFHAYEQGPPAITREFGGLGLGLSLVKALVELHGGTVTAASPGLGRGAVFTVCLPAATGAAARAAANHTPPAEPCAPLRPATARILFVEDHIDTARTLSKLLQAAGYHVRAAANRAEALALAEQEPFDLVLSDIGLPDGSGNELLQALQALHPIPGIALSGFGAAADIRQSRAVGFEEYLTKPVDLKHLLAAIQRVAAGQRAPGTHV